MFSACVTNLEDSVMAMGGAGTDHNNGIGRRDQGEGESGSKMILYDKGWFIILRFMRLNP